MIQILEYPSKDKWSQILSRPVSDASSLYNNVNSILSKVKNEGDKAIYELEEQFDKVKLSNLKVTDEEIKDSESRISDDLRHAIRIAKENIAKFHTQQQLVSKKIETTKGVNCWQRSVGIEKVGLYIPAGSAPLFSTLLMLAVPAKIAGCRDIVLCTPPNKEGNVHPAILFAAKEAGVSQIYKIGGVQAIAAMSYGTESLPKVYKIFGPGNQYVMAAKQLVSMKDVSIDMPAGPSEVLVIADETATPEFVAADLLSQAEHGADSQVILVSTNRALIDNVNKEIKIQLKQLSRKSIAQQALTHSRAILVNSIDEAIELSNEYAPEHLIIETKEYDYIASKITNAGSVFLGHYTPESAGDYASGTNHTLPTNGYAKAYSGVNLDSFVKKITFQEISKEGLNNLGKTIEIMAENEELTAHKNAVSLRLNK